jgi:coniferyl-aldehyde dehydrogenase
MSILKDNQQADHAPTDGDVAAIADMHAVFAAQRAAFANDRCPSLQERRSRIERLMGMLMAHRERISAALSSDFGVHPVPASDLIEVLGLVGRASYVLENLDGWMQPVPREIDPAMLGTARAYVQSQPKGVIGNMVPWNFPFDLSVGPMIDMLAAGNRVMVKPSEYTPACAALLREMVAATFEPDLVHVVVGGVALARAFTAMPWNHLLYTGSPDIGREVMAAAAKNLTPVTLELGGKCPALLTPGSVTEANVESIIGTKTIKNGQMCVSVDYCLVPRAELERFVDLAVDFMHNAAPAYSRGPDCTGIISNRHLDRLVNLLQEAEDGGARIVPLEAAGHIDHVSRRMPMYLVIDPPKDLGLMREEIFGPILPLLVYEEVDEAVAHVNAGERPLGLYVFGDDEAVIDHVLANTISGGVVVNACALQGALPSLGFGGNGMSGMGRHHGIDGFREFSNQRGVVVRGTGDVIKAFYAPYSNAAALIDAVLGGG